MSATSVPILPIEKGALAKLWGGVGLAVILAGALAWAGTRQFASGDCGDKAFLDTGGEVSAPAATASGLKIQTVRKGKGASPTDNDVALVNYSGSLAKDGKVFDANQRVPMPVQGLIPGFSEALKMMQPGGSYRICIPGPQGYGAKGTPDGAIPPNATLNFEVDLIQTMSRDEFQSMMMQEQMRQQQQGGGAQVPGRR
jgi:FKBP-type peptidyl-prolyl cis-trans isomerase FkpA